jgi:type I restriction enzyme M protein
MFLLHMLAHRRESKDGGSRVAIIMNGSPLFTGDAGSGESEIRRWVLEHDWLEALIALPEQLFYNTGIATYVWILTNRKAPERKRQVQLIDATSFWVPMRRSLGDKRREIPPEKAAEIVRLLGEFREGEHVRIFPTTHFGFRKITVERPLRLNFRRLPSASPAWRRRKRSRRSPSRRRRAPPGPRNRRRAGRNRKRSGSFCRPCRARSTRTETSSSACSRT